MGRKLSLFGIGFFLPLRREGCWTAGAEGMAKTFVSEGELDIPEGWSAGEAVRCVESNDILSPVSSPTKAFSSSIFLFFGLPIIRPSS
jgi:hypothetical protein